MWPDHVRVTLTQQQYTHTNIYACGQIERLLGEVYTVSARHSSPRYSCVYTGWVSMRPWAESIQSSGAVLLWIFIYFSRYCFAFPAKCCHYTPETKNSLPSFQKNRRCCGCRVFVVGRSNSLKEKTCELARCYITTIYSLWLKGGLKWSLQVCKRLCKHPQTVLSRASVNTP